PSVNNAGSGRRYGPRPEASTAGSNTCGSRGYRSDGCPCATWYRPIGRRGLEALGGSWALVALNAGIFREDNWGPGKSAMGPTCAISASNPNFWNGVGKRPPHFPLRTSGSGTSATCGDDVHRSAWRP